MARHHSVLQPLRTRPDTPTLARRRNSSQGIIPLPRSTLPLPSPTIVAARAYYIDQGTPIGAKAAVLENRESLNQGHQLPRRHSSTPVFLASQLENFSFNSSKSELSTVPEIEEESPNLGKSELQNAPEIPEEPPKVEVKEPQSVPEVVENSPKIAVKVETEETQDIVMSGSDQEVATPPQILRQVPFEFTHERLRGWGRAYLGNPSTSDVFVNAVSLKRPSLSLAQEDEYQVKSSYMVTIRARVNPRAKDKKPFIIQRQFDIDELRASIPIVRFKQEDMEENRSMSPQSLRRSSRARRSSAQSLDTPFKRRGSTETHYQHGRSASIGEAGIPIHVEYALHYLPVLAALMLSGHVRKGDSIDIPLPHPEAWPDVVAYIYTGCGILTPGMVANIRYLAGHA